MLSFERSVVSWRESVAKANQSRFLALFSQSYDACTVRRVRRCVVDQTLMGLAGMEAFYPRKAKYNCMGSTKII